MTSRVGMKKLPRQRSAVGICQHAQTQSAKSTTSLSSLGPPILYSAFQNPIQIWRKRKKERKAREGEERSRSESMADWGPVVVATVLFVLLTPGLLCQIPGRGRVVEFGSMCTSGLSILVHAILYFALVTIFIIAVGVHIYGGSG